MNSMFALMLLCVSPTEYLRIESNTRVEHVTVVHKVPEACRAILGGPVLPVAVAPPPIVAPVVPAPVERVEQPKVKKKIVKKKRLSRCKPGRTRNAKGVCGRWK